MVRKQHLLMALAVTGIAAASSLTAYDVDDAINDDGFFPHPLERDQRLIEIEHHEMYVSMDDATVEYFNENPDRDPFREDRDWRQDVGGWDEVGMTKSHPFYPGSPQDMKNRGPGDTKKPTAMVMIHLDDEAEQYLIDHLRRRKNGEPVGPLLGID